MFVMNDLTRRAIVEAIRKYGLTRCYEEDLHKGSALYCYWVNNNFFQSEAYKVLMDVENKFGAHGVLGRPRDHFSQTVVERTEERMFNYGFRGGRVLYIVDPLSFEIDSYLDKNNIPSKEGEYLKAVEEIDREDESRNYRGSMLKESSDSKYELTDETMKWKGWLVLYRIRALRSFGDVKKGDKGGWVERIGNLSLSGDCWIYDDAKVFGPAKVCHDSQVRDEVEIQGYTGIYGNSKICGNTTIGGRSSLTDVEVRGRDVKLYDVTLQGVRK